MQIVDDESRITGRQGKIVVEGDTAHEVMDTAAKQLALEKAASLGMSKPGISGNGGAYPVQADGTPHQGNVLTSPENAKYRCDYDVTAAF